MKDFKRFGAVSICIWSVLLILIGLTQFTFGAYYISVLPIFKLASPVWSGFLNILCATGLLALHYKKLQVSLCQSFNEATRTVAGETADHQDQQRQCLKRLKCSPVNDTAIYWSLSLCFTIILINSINAIVCEVGEWNVWISASEVQVLHSATPLGKIAQQAHYITSTQTCTAFLLGILCCSFNIWLIYKYKRNDACGPMTTSVDNLVENGAGGAAAAAANKKTCLKPPVSFDNPNWVYGDNQAAKSTPDKATLEAQSWHSAQTATCNHVAPARGGGGGGEMAAIRTATIRRAPSIIHSLPENFSQTRDQLRTSSFRTLKNAARPAASVQRSQTMKETPFTSIPRVHRTSPAKEDAAAAAAAMKVRNADRIVLRVQSLRHVAPRGGGAAVRNVKRVSSSTQTDVSITKAREQVAAVNKNRRPLSRSHLLRTLQDIDSIPSADEEEDEDEERQDKERPASLATLVDERRAVQMATQAPPGHGSRAAPSKDSSSHVFESSSGYSSPLESKSSTPELGYSTRSQQFCNADDSQPCSNVTVIEIDPKLNDTHQIHAGIDATYAVPRKKSPQTFQVSIQSKPTATAATAAGVHRSVSFHQGSWTNKQMQTIPRPRLSRSRIINNHARAANTEEQIRIPRPATNLSRSSSVHAAMSEMQRKLVQISSLPYDNMAAVHRRDRYANEWCSDEDGHEQPRADNRSSVSPDFLRSADTLAYLTELEVLARHWKTQLMYNVAMRSKRMTPAPTYQRPSSLACN